jgi:hypothetical protein
MKKIRGDKPSGVIIHTYMKISQGNSMCTYLYLKLKCHTFIFFLLQNQRTGGWNRSCLGWGKGLGNSESGEVAGKGGGRVNMVQKMYTHTCKCRDDTCLNHSKNQGSEDKGER